MTRTKTAIAEKTPPADGAHFEPIWGCSAVAAISALQVYNPRKASQSTSSLTHAHIVLRKCRWESGQH
eukprot:scaffold70250_cov32-Tisochrysis_lutea.AAC.3